MHWDSRFAVLAVISCALTPTAVFADDVPDPSWRVCLTQNDCLNVRVGCAEGVVNRAHEAMARSLFTKLTAARDCEINRNPPPANPPVCVQGQCQK